jgi:hypothetical protein
MHFLTPCRVIARFARNPGRRRPGLHSVVGADASSAPRTEATSMTASGYSCSRRQKQHPASVESVRWVLAPGEEGS